MRIFLSDLMNVSVEQTTTVGPQMMPTSKHIMWVPSVAIACLFILGLCLSFRRHRRRKAKKRQYIVEYQEKNLSARRPRIRGKLAGSDTPMTDSLSHLYSEATGVSHVYETGDNNRLLSTDDVRFSLDDFPKGQGSGNVKKHFRSAYELDELNTSYYRQISDDEYFRRKRPREWHYLKAASDRHLSPRRQRQRVHDCDVKQKSFWIRSDVRNPNESEVNINQPAVKYIKVFDLDLCEHCRMYVEKVDGSLSKATSPRGSRNSQLYVPSEKVCGSTSVNVDALPRIAPQASFTSRISIAEVHSPPHPQCQFQPIERHNSSENIASRTKLAPSDSERPRSAPDLNENGIEMSEFLRLSVQGKSDVSTSSPTVCVM